MFCYNCGEENPEEAKYCRNCGALLKTEETVKKVEVIEAPNHQKSTNHQQTTTTSGSKSDSSSWIACCCFGLIIIFILSALFSGV